MSRRLRFRGAAGADVRRAKSWYEREAPHMVDAFLEEFRAVVDVRRALMTRFSYAIYFTLDEETIMVYAVLHQARHENRWKRRVPREKR